MKTFLAFCMVLITFVSPHKKKLTSIKSMPEISIDVFCLGNLEREIAEHDIMYPEIVLQQAKLETGNFTSYLFEECNNLFGMRVPQQRECAPGLLGESYYHACYDTWEQSVLDYAIWQEAMIKWGRLDTTSAAAYYHSLDAFYATADAYSSTLKQQS